MTESTPGDARPAVVKRTDAVERRPVAAGTATETQVLLGADDGAPHFAMRRFTLGTGGGMPRHTNMVEHEQYVLRGRARIGIGEVHEVGAHDVFFIPAGTPQYYEVIEAPFEFLCMLPNAPDRIEILEGPC
ncbi:MAG TPA: cupin domain-containing protein [Thermoanaerobaculia bacterium]|jgi:quercetin dioxygenase-like cupin family protein